MNQTTQSQATGRNGKTPETIMASYLTHELRAPVTAIKLGLEIFEEQVATRLQADERQMLTLAIKNTGRLQGLVNDIMDYTKVLAGKMKLDFQTCDARELLSEVVDSFQAWAISKGIRLVKEDSNEPLPRIKAEPKRVIQVLTNLLSNALKFTPARGTVTVGVKAGKYEHAGTLVFRVKDSGAGIPAEHLESIFETFSQSVTNGKQSDGTGLGLTLARSMVQLHGGKIWAESWKGLGATFRFTIPISPEDLPEPIEVYANPVEYHGLFVDVYRKLNAFVAMLF
ncbi:MAG: HAMP domain-containing histidine kinase [Elusimicrobia bacterium]|nr:HAMP domain-containing histidine kinase [Elusimicrobiota bacterium]